jgi:hypothetical protein
VNLLSQVLLRFGQAASLVRRRVLRAPSLMVQRIASRQRNECAVTRLAEELRFVAMVFWPSNPEFAHVPIALAPQRREITVL